MDVSTDQDGNKTLHFNSPEMGELSFGLLGTGLGYINHTQYNSEFLRLGEKVEGTTDFDRLPSIFTMNIPFDALHVAAAFMAFNDVLVDYTNAGTNTGGKANEGTHAHARMETGQRIAKGALHDLCLVAGGHSQLSSMVAAGKNELEVLSN